MVDLHVQGLQPEVYIQHMYFKYMKMKWMTMRMKMKMNENEKWKWKWEMKDENKNEHEHEHECILPIVKVSPYHQAPSYQHHVSFSIQNSCLPQLPSLNWSEKYLIWNNFSWKQNLLQVHSCQFCSHPTFLSQFHTIKVLSFSWKKES